MVVVLMNKMKFHQQMHVLDIVLVIHQFRLPGLTTDNTDEALSSYLVNPFVAVADNQRKQLRKNFNMLGSFSWEIIDNLTI